MGKHGVTQRERGLTESTPTLAGHGKNLKLVPYFDLALKDLLFMNQATPSVHANGEMNFSKLEGLAVNIRMIMRCKKSVYGDSKDSSLQVVRKVMSVFYSS